MLSQHEYIIVPHIHMRNYMYDDGDGDGDGNDNDNEYDLLNINFIQLVNYF